jgi:lysophospholipase L1-like esterase
MRLGSAHTVQNFGVSGATLLKNGDKPYWNEASYGASGSFAPDVVVIMLGTNDAKPQNWSRESEFSPDYLELIQHYRSLGALVYVATPPPVYPPGAFDISPDVVANEVVPAVRAIASDAGAPLVDVFSALGGQSENFPDTVHPNAAGAAVIADTVRAALAESGFGGAGPAAGAGGMGQGGRASAGQGGVNAAGNGAGGAPGGGAGAAAGRAAGGEATTSGGAAGQSGGPSSAGGAGGETNGSGGLAGGRASGGAPTGGAPGGAGRASGAGTGGGGTSGAGPAVAGASGSEAATPNASNDSGCGCRVTGSAGLGHPAWFAMFLAALWALGRRGARRLSRRG